MGARGPKPKSNVINLLNGNPSRRPINEAAPEPVGPPVKPSGVADCPEASAAWDQVIASMPPALFTAADSLMLEIYSVAVAEMRSAIKDIQANGLSLDTKEGFKTNPALQQWKSAIEAVIKTADRLGLSPGVRSRLQVPAGHKEKQSRFGDLMK